MAMVGISIVNELVWPELGRDTVWVSQSSSS
ncbi:hypothetical protein SAMN05892883_2494 [Jatrophihabitans sp. GAS493]|nr:hypothetical protein SAMN05892883_2494 [Jatrophihabitans sp. GAS493]